MSRTTTNATKTSDSAASITAPKINIEWSDEARHAHGVYTMQGMSEELMLLMHRAAYNRSNAGRRALNKVARQSIAHALGEAKPLYSTLQTQLKTIAFPLWKIDIAFVDDEAMRELNNEHLGKNKPTDVLSFPVWEGEMFFPLPPGETALMLGDIVISIETAVRQSQELKHDLSAEVAFLAVHGVLHLLGYDHGTDGERRKMFALQDEIVAQVREAKGF